MKIADELHKIAIQKSQEKAMQQYDIILKQARDAAYEGKTSLYWNKSLPDIIVKMLIDEGFLVATVFNTGHFISWR